ncbi:MAG: homoserine kinase [Candidatus Marinimicrobia bacterium]|nr:homoserine kinase [Candidatus Neomarinimicrobiota bacterium]|tara:strand:- start:12014 stop:12934 length:921 start_codon:yes stop_codon:yes gene_type:complete
MNWIKVFAPATVANLGPGLDVLGMAVEGWGDTVEANRSESDVSIVKVISDYPIPSDAKSNTASLAAMEVLKKLGNPGGVQLRIKKGLPNGSGLGSSAASAAAGAFSANFLYGSHLAPEQLIDAATRAEEVVSARHADNTAPSLLGGAILVKSVSPLTVIELGAITSLKLILVTPRIEIFTKEARKLLPNQLSLKDTVTAMANTSAITAAFMRDDYDLMVSSLLDVIAEPQRKGLIPHFDQVKQAALSAGADGLVISGSGPTLCAFSNGTVKEGETIRNAMVKEFEKGGFQCQSIVSRVDRTGTRIL